MLVVKQFFVAGLVGRVGRIGSWVQLTNQEGQIMPITLLLAHPDLKTQRHLCPWLSSLKNSNNLSEETGGFTFSLGFTLPSLGFKYVPSYKLGKSFLKNTKDGSRATPNCSAAPSSLTLTKWIPRLAQSSSICSMTSRRFSAFLESTSSAKKNISIWQFFLDFSYLKQPEWEAVSTVYKQSW